MSAPVDLMDLQRRNNLLSGMELRAAAEKLAFLPKRPGLVVVPFDDPGHRILGAALALSFCVTPADHTRRYTGPVLLLGGYQAGPLGVVQAAQLAWSLGATHVEVAYLGGWEADVEGVSARYILGGGS